MIGLARLLAFVGIFGLVGPAVGGLVAWVGMGIRSLRSPIPFVTGAYPEGIELALAAGVLTGVGMLWLGKLSWVVPASVTLLVVGFFLALSVLDDLGRPDLVVHIARLAAVFLPPSLVATITCWWLARRLLS